MDISPPEVEITAPKDGAYISDKVEITVQTEDNKIVKKIELYIDGDSLPFVTVETPPFSYYWQRFMDANPHTLKAKAIDGAGNWRESDSIIVQSLPILVSSYNLSYNVYDISLSGNYLFLATKSGLRIIDISNPSSPYEVASCDTGFYVDDVHVQDNYAYIVCSNKSTWDDFLKIVDISNPTTPAIVGVCSLNYDGDDVFVSGQYAYITRWCDYSYRPLQIFDISNPSNPYLVGWIDEYDTKYLTDISIHSGYAYALGNGSLRIIDVSNPSTPHTIAEIDEYGNRIFIEDNFVYTNRGSIIDISTPQSPQLIGDCDGGDDIYVTGDYAFLSWTYGLRIAEVSNKEEPLSVGEIKNESWWWSNSKIIVSIPYAYIVDGGLNIVQILP